MSAMIRFIRFPELSSELFAFYNTVTDNFLTFNGMQAFSDFEEIEWSYQNNIKDDSQNFDIERLRGFLKNESAVNRRKVQQ